MNAGLGNPLFDKSLLVSDLINPLKGGLIVSSYKDLSAGNADARAFGLAEVEETDEVFELHPKGVKAYQLFSKALSQMRFLPSGVALGLDYAAVEVVRKSQAIKRKHFSRMQLIEQGFLSTINAR